MIRLHVLHHQVVRLPAAQHGLDILQPLLAEARIHRVHHGNLVIHNHIGIICHAIGHQVLALEQIHPVVIHAHIANIIGNHCIPSFYISSAIITETPRVFQ